MAVLKYYDQIEEVWKPVSQGLGTNTVVTKEVPSGAINGTNATFTTANEYVSGTLEVFVNGLRQGIEHVTEGVGTFTLAEAPSTGDNLEVSYLHSTSAAGNAQTLEGRPASDFLKKDEQLPANTVDAQAIQEGAVNEKVGSEIGFLGNTQYFTSSGTYTKPEGLKYVIVEVQAAGGGGGGAESGSGNGEGGSGGGGGYSLKKILASALATSETVTRGSGGNGGSAGNNSGSSGGSSSFGSHCSATGGSGGSGGANSTGNVRSGGGSGGNGSGGDINISGGNGSLGWVSSGIAIRKNIGGGSMMAPANPENSSALNVNGTSGKLYGGGGSGGSCSSASVTGGNGAHGTVKVHEYF